MTTRRRFVTDSARWAAGIAFGGRLLPLTRATGRTTPNTWLPDPMDADVLRALAAQAIDAARQAGASFADIRIGEARECLVAGGYPRASVALRAGYGIRALVDGTWGMAHGENLTTDAVTTVARDAVAAARTHAVVHARVNRRPVVLAPAPAVTGVWTSRADVSPFLVPLDDHARVLGSWERAVAPLYGARMSAGVTWEALTRVVASSEGTLVTQHVTRARPEATVEFSMRRYTDVGLRVPTLNPTTAGFEVVMDPAVPRQILATAEECFRLARLPMRGFEAVGRFPVVFNGDTVATMLGTTLGQALDGDRVAGLEADAAGTSFLGVGASAPFSPLVTVSADRAAPAYTAVEWDDEGVAPSPVTLVERGEVRSYLTTRETAPLIGADVRSAGCAVAPDPMHPVLSGGANLTLAPSATPAPLDTLLRGITHGLLCYGGRCWPEPGVSTGLFRARGLMEVRQGTVVAHVKGDIAFQFQTRRWWSTQLRALGDASTNATALVSTQKGMPWQTVTQVATAPAALVADVDVVPADARAQ